MWDAFPSALDLARFQFAFTVSFHFLFPAFTIGLASFLAVLEGLWLWTGRQAYLDLFRYWLKIFAVAFAMGVVSGIVMSYQFGTNWSVFSDRTAPVLGPLMAYEVLTAFFLEAGFLGVMLFGLERVGRKLHFAATSLVAVGTLISGFWILSANSWMHTPAGHSVAPDGRFLPEDWWAIVFNPSFPLRYLHTINGAYITTALVVGAVSAFYLLREHRRRDQPGDVTERVRIGFSMAMWLVLVAAPVQAVLGDLQGGVAYKHQPAKVAAMEGHFETHRGAPLVLFGLPNVKERRNDLEIAIPNVASLYLTHSWDGEVVGLNDLPPETHPTNVPLVFFSFRVMVGLGLLMIALAATGLVLRLRGRLFGTPWFLRWAVAMGPAGSVAVIAGWIVTEAGRQPFTVYGLLRTADSVSPISAPAVAASLLAFIVVYFLVFGAGTWYLFRLFGQPPHVHEQGPEAGRPVRTAGITAGHAVDPDRMGGGRRSGAPVPAAPAE